MVRVMILLLLAGSAWLGWNYTQQEKTLEAYEAAIVPDGPIDQTIRATQVAAYKYRALQDLAANGGAKIDNSTEASVFSKIQAIAQIPQISFGGMTVSKPSAKTHREGYLDSVYHVEHRDSKEAVKRDRLANFFYKLERSHRSMKVTSIDLSLAKKAKPTEIPVDEWDVEFDVIVREEKKKGKRGRR